MYFITAFLCLFLILTLYFYYKQKYFTLRQSLPGMSPHFLFGNVLQTRCLKGESYINVQAKLKAMYGDIYQYWLGPYHYYVFNKAEHAEHIFAHKMIYDLPQLTFGQQFPLGLVSIRGANYRRHARLILPMFKKANVIHHIDMIIDCTDQLIQRWKMESIKCQTKFFNTNIAEESKILLLDIISLVAFNYDLNSNEIQASSTNRQELIEALNIFTDMYDVLVKSAGIPTIIMQIFMTLNKKYQNAVSVLEKYADTVIEQDLERRKKFLDLNSSESHPKRATVIETLVNSWLIYEKQINDSSKHNHEGEHYQTKNSLGETSKSTTNKQSKGISREELFDEILVLILAGFATTSSALSWFIYYMSKFPTIQKCVKQELKSNNIQRDTPLTLDLLNRLAYVDCVLKELLRFAPIVNSARRTLTQDDQIDGIKLKKGDSVLIPLYNLHMDNRYWKLNPREFIPERFNSVDKNHHPYALLTFGGGHRQCIGQDLARLELKIMITRLMQQVTVHDGGDLVNSGGHRQSLTNSPRNIAVFIDFDR